MRVYTKEESEALEELGISFTAFDTSRMTLEACNDLIRLCVLHAQIKMLQNKLDCLEDENDD